MRHLKPLLAFCAHLHKQHGFLFALTYATDPDLCKVCFSQFPFNLLVVPYPVLKSLTEEKSDAEEWNKLLDSAHKRAALTVVTGIEDANALTSAISERIDFVQGDFIASEQEEIEAVVGVDSVQIGS